MSRFFTSESVTEGHPDKLCDQLSDAILDDCLRADPMSRVACECSAATGFVLVMGEITTRADLNIQLTARDVIDKIGYNRADYGFDSNTCAVLVALHDQSPDIAMGVNTALEGRDSGVADIGAGDQGMMFGYACDETPERMPAPIALSHRLTKRLAEARKTGELSYLRPDGKSQVTVEYDGDKPVRIDTVVVSTQHNPDVSHAQIEQDVIELIIRKALPAELLDARTRFFVNPTGRFVIGGPMGDSGLTGRKIIVDTYGGYARHGGGCFSGKDPTKVDRSAAYALRHVALNIIEAGLAKRVELEAAYAIGVAKPVSLLVDTFGTGVIPDERLMLALNQVFDLRPGAIIRDLDLRRPIYRQTAAYGHFGRTDLELPWEKTNRADELKALAAKIG